MTEQKQSRKDYYRVLGLDRSATPEEVRKAFRRLAFEHHPDRNRQQGAEARFKEINEAYQVLSDPPSRAAYDRSGVIESRSTFGKGFDGFEFGGMGDIFDAFFGGASGARRTPQKGSDLRVEMAISFEEAIFGCRKDIEVSRLEVCPECRSSGCKPGTAPDKCSACSGTGQMQRAERSVFGRFVNVVPCDHCNGDGKVVLQPCTRCGGKGRERQTRRLKATVPLGVDQGHRLCLSTEGDAGLWGGPAGDLYVVLAVAAHPVLKREGEHLLYDLPLDFAQAALGDRLEIPSLEGPVSLDVPPGTQTGHMLRVKGKGARKLGGNGRGDLLARARVVTPTTLGDRERQLLEQLREALRSNVPPPLPGSPASPER